MANEKAGFSQITGQNSYVVAGNASFDGTERGGGLTTNGQLWIGNTATGSPTVNTLTAGSGVSITNGNGSIEIALAGAGTAIDSIGTQTGTNPIAPTAAGLVTINGSTVAAGTNPVRTDGTDANTMAVEVQISQALAATDATKIGLSNFNSTNFSVDANGFVTALTTNTDRPAFLVVPSATINNVTGDSTVYTIIWDSITSQYGSNFSVGTGLFTAPVTGFYQFNASVQLSGLLLTHTTLFGNFVTSAGPYYFSFTNPFVGAESTFGTYTYSGSLTIRMTAGQTCGVQATVTGGTKVVDIATASQFSGFLVC